MAADLDPTKVPLLPVRINRASPLAAGLGGAFLFRNGQRREIITNSAPISEVPPTNIVTPYGQGALYDGATMSTTFGAGVVTTGAAWTIAFLAQAFSGGGNTVYAEQLSSTWPNNLLTIYYGSSVSYFMDDGAANTNPGSVGNTTNWHLMVMVQTGISSRINYLDGASVVSDTTTIQPLLATTATFGASVASGGPTQLGAVSLAGGWTWNRALPASDLALLQLAPFSMYAPLARRQYYMPSAPVTVLADSWYNQTSQPLITRPEMVPY